MLRKIVHWLKQKKYYLKRSIQTAKALHTVKKHGVETHVNAKCLFTRQCEFGNNCNFNGMTVRGWGHVFFGDNFHSGQDCLIITHVHNYKGDAIPYDNTYIHKDVKIEDNVWLGDRVIVLGGVTIGEGAIIQAGSVVVKDIPPLAIAGGHPAVPFKCRDKEHYDRLKELGQFN